MPKSKENENKDINKKKVFVQKKIEIDWSKFKELLKLGKHSKSLKNFKIINIPKKIDYEDFILMICRGCLECYDSKTWKRYVNDFNDFDNSYPLFWACEYRNITSIKLLLDNGSLYIPKKLVNSYALTPIGIIIKMLLQNKNRNFRINCKRFINCKLTNEELSIENEKKSYIEIVKILLDKFPGVINYKDVNNLSYIEYSLMYGYFELTTIILKKYKFFTKKFLKNFYDNFEKIIELLYHRYEFINAENNLIIILKELRRYKNILILKLFLKLFKKSNFCVEKYSSLIKKKLGTLEIYDSIFYEYSIKYSDNNDYNKILNILSDFKHKNNLVGVDNFMFNMKLYSYLEKFKCDNLESMKTLFLD